MTKKQMTLKTRCSRAAAVVALATMGCGFRAVAQAYPVPKSTGGFGNAPQQQVQLPPMPVPAAITPNGTVVEDVVVRVNDQIITRSELERSEEQLIQEGQQQGVPPAEVEAKLRDLLRDMIDQKLLLSKGKELGITGDAETIRQLDEIRKQNHLDSMEALEKAAAQQGVSFEDFKQGIRNRIITQKVVQEEVGRRLQPTHAQEQAYYDAHAKEFEQPEQVHLSEILVPTAENATDAQIVEAQAKADGIAAKLKAGAKFADLAKTDSGGPTANAGGDLGDFKRGTLGDVLEKATFALDAGGVTAPIRTRQGFVILRVDSHQKAGVPPLDQVEAQVQEAVYMDALQPALREYLTKARNEAYLDVKAGFVDTGSAGKTNKPAFTAYAPPPMKKKSVAKQKAEQERAEKAQAELAAARERVAEKQAAKAAAEAHKAGVKNVSMPVKPKKVAKEKIRYGQAPRNSLPKGGAAEEESLGSVGAPIAGQAAGVAMAPTQSVTSITTGTGVDDEADPFATKVVTDRKTRFSERQTEQVEKAATVKVAKAEVKATTRPVTATKTEAADEKVQGSALGLNGDTVKKQPKPKKKKGDPKERLGDQQKAPEAPVAPVAPTVNPALGAGGVVPTTAPTAAPTTAPAK